MAYALIQWKDRQVQFPRRFTEVYDQDGKRTDTPSPGEIHEQGTQISATHLNQMDRGIGDAQLAAALLLMAVQQNKWAIEALQGSEIQDLSIMTKLMLNGVRQNEWRIDHLEEATGQEVGTKALTNTARFPFNNSKASVALENRRDNCNYIVVIEEVTGSGNVGEVEVTDRLVNGFKLSFTGSAKNVTVKYAVIGGYEKHE